MADKDGAEELLRRVKGQRFFMLTSVDDDGTLISRPMTVQEQDGWAFVFIAQDDDDTVRQSVGKQVNLALMDGGVYVSLSGTGSVNRSTADKRALWNRLNEAYAGEAENPDNVILRIDVTQGAYWDAGNAVSRVIGLAKAAISGERPDDEHGTAEL